MSLINKEALYCDETENYRRPAWARTGEEVVFSFRTAAGEEDSVFFCLFREEGGIESYPMERQLRAGDEEFSVYLCRYVPGREALRYAFRVENQEECLWFDRWGISEEEAKHCFVLTPGFVVPEWSRGAVMYQIFTDRFCNGDERNNVVDGEYRYLDRPVVHADWNSPVEDLDVGRFYGGDLPGIRSKLDYLQDLGVEAIYLNPVFVSPSNHKYDSQDYDHVDPHLTVIARDVDGLPGPEERDNRHAEKYRCRTVDEENLRASDAYFADFIAEVHRRGMRVIIDGVFNHCGSFHRWLDREGIYLPRNEKGEAGARSGDQVGAFWSDKSPYRDYFDFGDPYNWPANDSYDGWWDQPTLPKLNYEASPELCREILRIGRKWVSPPFSADGWRLDVAADLGHSAAFNHRFWQQFRKAVKEANPEALIVAEHYGDPSDWLKGDQWDTVMNYDAFMEPVSWLLTGMEKHSDRAQEELLGDGNAFFGAMRENMARMQAPSRECAMNQLSNHDHSRFMTRTNRHVGRLADAGSWEAENGVRPEIFRQGIMIQMTWPGAPTFYYGDEVGLCGWTDPDSRRPFPWDRMDLELLEFCHIAVWFHRMSPALRTGSLLPLLSQQGGIAYGRFSCPGGRTEEAMVTAINTGEESRSMDIQVWRLGVPRNTRMRRLLLSTAQCYNAGQIDLHVEDGCLHLLLPPVSAVLLGWRPEDEQQQEQTAPVSGR